MEILRARTVKVDGYANAPTIEALVDHIPRQDELVYEVERLDTESRIFYAEQDGYVHYLYHTSRNEDGFGGATFTLKTRLGTVTIKGPWASRSSVVNEYFGPCIEANLTTDPVDYAEGYCQYAGNMTLELLARYKQEHGELPTYLKQFRNGGIYVLS